MSNEDARTLSAEAQEALRVRVIQALRGGLKPAVAARTFGVSRTAVFYWRRAVTLGNVRSLRSKKRGRPPEPRLPAHQAATIVKQITDRTPDQLKLPFALWTRAALRDLIAQRCAVTLSIRTVGRYLKRWGFTPQKPLRLRARPSGGETLERAGVPGQRTAGQDGKGRDSLGRSVGRA